MAVKSYSDLIAWRKAMDLATAIYAATARFPADEVYGLRNQIRRAAVSVPSNIAEGQGRTSTNEFLHHLSIARGSLCELETQIALARRLTYLEDPCASELLASTSEVGRLINGLRASLTRS